MDKQALQKMLSEKEDYLEKVKVELFGISGQIQLLKDLISKTEEAPKGN